MDMHAQLLSHVQTSVSPRTVACLVPLSMQFSRQEFWSGMKFPTPEDLQNWGLNLHLSHLLHWQADLYHYITWEARQGQ